MNTYRTGDDSWDAFQLGRRFVQAIEGRSQIRDYAIIPYSSGKPSQEEELERSCAILGWLSQYLDTEATRIMMVESYAKFFFLAAFVLISMSLFGLTLYGPLHFVLIFLLGTFSAIAAYRTHLHVKRICLVNRVFQEQCPIFYHVDNALDALKFFLVNFERSEQYVSGYTIRILPCDRPLDYWRYHFFAWSIYILVPFYFSISIFLSIFRGENGWFNWIGINLLGW